MKNKKFFDVEHARLYLVGSIIRIDSAPILVLNVSYSGAGYMTIQYRPIEKTEGNRNINIKSLRIDMTPLPLGFINFREFGKKTVALSTYRIPSRQWRIGLTTENLMIIPQKYNNSETKRKIMKSIFFKRNVCGLFPKIKEIIEMIKNKEATSQAFSRDFAINKNKLMFIQVKEPVGKVFNDEVMLSDDYLYLNQLLEKVI